MPWFSSTFLGITRTTTLTCQRSQVGVLSRPSPECSNARSADPPTGRGFLPGHCGVRLARAGPFGWVVTRARGREFLVCLLCIGSTLQDCQERLLLSHKQHHLLLTARMGCRPAAGKIVTEHTTCRMDD